MRIDTYKIKLANKVLAAVKKLLAPVEHPRGSSLFLGMFQNGREQGYSLCYIPPIKSSVSIQTVYFSESRGSDNLVVYREREGKMPWPQAASENAWGTVKAFHPDKATTDGAKYIVECLGLKG